MFENPEDLLPHKEPFLFVDKILQIEKGKKIVAQKIVREDEFWVEGHFPGNPVMPGVLLIETIAQTCALLVLKTYPEFVGVAFYLVSVKEAKLKKIVRIGDRLIVESELIKRRGNFWFMKGRILCEGQEVASCEISAFSDKK